MHPQQRENEFLCKLIYKKGTLHVTLAITARGGCVFISKHLGEPNFGFVLLCKLFTFGGCKSTAHRIINPFCSTSHIRS